MLAALLPFLTGLFGKALDSVFPNPEDEAKKIAAMNQLQMLMIQNAGELQKSAADIITSEIKGESWLQRNWRPMVMLAFCGLIVARWMGYVAPNLSQEEYIKLWDIVQVGLNGYIITRSAEKVVPAVADALRKR